MLRFRVHHPQTGVAGWRPPVAARVGTDARGVFEAALGAGVRYHVTITHATHGTYESFFVSASGEAEFQLDRDLLVRGHVRSASDRRPLAGAWIRAGGLIRGHSGDDGSFLVSGVLDQLVYVGADEHATRVFGMRTHRRDVEVVLQSSRHLRGMVQVPSGEPLSGLALEIRGHRETGVPIEIHNVVTDEKGAYSIAAAGRSPAYVVVCRALGLQGVAAVAPPTALDEVDLGTLQLELASVVLRGRVTGPVSPTRVLLPLTPRVDFAAEGDSNLWRLQRSFGSRLAFADADGRFVLQGLAAGPYRITAQARGWPELRRDVTVPTKDDSLALAMQGSKPICGRLLDSESHALAGHSCSCGHSWGTAVTDAEGRFELRGSRSANAHRLEIRTIGGADESCVDLCAMVQAGDEEQVFRAPGPSDIQGSVALEWSRLWRSYTVEVLVDGRVVATAQGDQLDSSCVMSRRLRWICVLAGSARTEIPCGWLRRSGSRPAHATWFSKADRLRLDERDRMLLHGFANLGVV